MRDDMADQHRGAANADGPQAAYERFMAAVRDELLAHCYRMLGSFADAQDASQEAQLRAWRAFERFDPAGSFNAWVYTIATNVCLTRLNRRQPRLLPWAGDTEPRQGGQPLPPPLAADRWIEPLPDHALAAADAEHATAQRERVGLAFVLLLQHFTPQQRAAFVLRDIAGFSAKEVAAMLETTESAVNSALARARAAIDRLSEDEQRALQGPIAPGIWSRAQEYVRATANGDLDLLTALLREDARLCMPPHPAWYRGRTQIATFFRTALGDVFARRGYRLVATGCNGAPAFGLYEQPAHAVGADPPFEAIGLQVLGVEEDWVAEIHCFLNPELVAQAGLPLQLTGG